MTLKERIIEANNTNNIKEFSLIAEALRLGNYKIKGQRVYCTYKDVADIFRSCANISKERFETIMYECDSIEED